MTTFVFWDEYVEIVITVLLIVGSVVGIYIAFLMFCEGTIGNKYGPDPCANTRAQIRERNSKASNRHFNFDHAEFLFNQEIANSQNKHHFYSKI